MKALRIAVFILLAPMSFLAQVPGAAVQGSVLKAGGGGPIAGARVELVRTDGTTPQTYSGTTSGDGTFIIQNARPGQYRVVASHSGFLRREFGQRSRDGYGLTLNLETGQQLRNLEIELRPSAAISGRVTDREGSPMVAAEVRAMLASYPDGQRTLRVVQSTITNDLGEYRLFGLPAGQYFVSVSASVDIPLTTLILSASPPNSIGNVLSGPLGRPRSGIYYPSATDSRSATPIDLTSGGDFGGVNITVVSSRTYHIRGTVPGGMARVALVPADSGLASSVVQVDASNGPFDFSNVASGQYTLVARSGDLLGMASVDLGERDLENITVGLNPSVPVPTRVSFEDRTPGDMDPGLEDVTFTLIANPPIPGGEPEVYGPFSNGFLSFGVLLRQDYRIALRSVQTADPNARLRDVYIKSIRMGTRDVLNDGFRIDDAGNIPLLEIVLGLQSGILTGTVTSEKQKPQANALIVLIPEAGRRRWSDSFRIGTSDLAGRFVINRIPPGDYIAFSWEEVEEGAWTDPEFLKKFEERGKKIRIGEGGNQALSITAIP